MLGLLVGNGTYLKTKIAEKGNMERNVGSELNSRFNKFEKKKIWFFLGTINIGFLCEIGKKKRVTKSNPFPTKPT